MKIPKSIKVGGHIYTISFDHGLTRLEGRAGKCTYPSQEISLFDELHPDALNEAFIHEVIHAIDNHFCDGHLDESIVSGLSEGLFQVFSDMGIAFTK